jgi:hypothetical protein
MEHFLEEVVFGVERENGAADGGGMAVAQGGLALDPRLSVEFHGFADQLRGLAVHPFGEGLEVLIDGLGYIYSDGFHTVSLMYDGGRVVSRARESGDSPPTANRWFLAKTPVTPIGKSSGLHQLAWKWRRAEWPRHDSRDFALHGCG